MSDHTTALVPVASGYIQSTDIFARGRPVDTGLLAEALIYYDRVLVNVDNPVQFTQLISWLIQQGLSVPDIISLFRDGVLGIYDFAFFTSPYVNFEADGLRIHGLFNGQDQRMLKPNSFHERYVDFDSLRTCFENTSQFEDFSASLEGRIIEVKADEIGATAIENAYQDFLNPERNSLMAQQLVNEIYRIKGLGKPPRVEAHVEDIGGGEFRVTWNLPLNQLPAVEIDTNIAAAGTLPLSTAAQANKYLWAAHRLKCDLYLARPVSVLVGDKLFEAGEVSVRSRTKSRNVIEELQIKVEFPDLRQYINQDRIDFNRVLEIRKKARNFRRWLQTEGDRSRDALTAYHQEVAKASGFANIARTSLKLFGVVGGAALGAVITSNPAIGAAAGAAGGAALGAGAGEAVAYVSELAASVGTDWKPVVFGDWYSAKISKLLNQASRD